MHHSSTVSSMIDALLDTMPAIDQALLQFIDVMNLLDQLLYFSPYFIDMCSWVVKGLVKRTQKVDFLALGDFLGRVCKSCEKINVHNQSSVGFHIYHFWFMPPYPKILRKIAFVRWLRQERDRLHQSVCC